MKERQLRRRQSPKSRLVIFPKLISAPDLGLHGYFCIEQWRDEVARHCSSFVLCLNQIKWSERSESWRLKITSLVEESIQPERVLLINACMMDRSSNTTECDLLLASRPYHHISPHPQLIICQFWGESKLPGFMYNFEGLNACLWNAKMARVYFAPNKILLPRKNIPRLLDRSRIRTRVISLWIFRSQVNNNQ